MIKYIAEKAQALCDPCAGEHESVQTPYGVAGIALDSSPTPDKLAQWFQALCIFTFQTDGKSNIKEIKQTKPPILEWPF